MSSHMPTMEMVIVAVNTITVAFNDNEAMLRWLHWLMQHKHEAERTQAVTTARAEALAPASDEIVEMPMPPPRRRRRRNQLAL